MQPAAEAMAAALSEVAFHAPKVPLVGNVTAEASTDPDAIRARLVEQVTGRVRWRECVGFMAANGVTETWEIGAGKALSGMVKRIDRAVETRTVGTPAEVQAASASVRDV
jgi:[acyl-carrier-protein] S-malonyltransferase